jgi:cell wall-associated NlpC family hydrolase
MENVSSMASKTLKRTVSTAIAAGMLSAGTITMTAAPATAAPVTIPGIGTFEVPDNFVIPTNFEIPQFQAPALPVIPELAPVNVAAPWGAGSAVANAALSKVGSPYVWGGTGPNGFDCSGLTSWAHQQLGISIPRTSQAQANAGIPVAYNALQPGDVVLMYGGASHAAIYIGNGQVVHALNSSVPVKVDNLSAFPFHSARRYA